MLRNVLFLWWNTPVKSVQIYQTIFLPFELICRVKIIKYHILTIFWRYNWSFIQYSKDRQLIFPVLFTDIFLILSFVFFKHLITAQRSIIYLTWLSTQCWCHCCVHVAEMKSVTHWCITVRCTGMLFVSLPSFHCSAPFGCADWHLETWLTSRVPSLLSRSELIGWKHTGLTAASNDTNERRPLTGPMRQTDWWSCTPTHIRAYGYSIWGCITKIDAFDRFKSTHADRAWRAGQWPAAAR